MQGVQTPRYCSVPAFKYSDADDAAFLSSGYGLTPDPWQFDVLRAWLARRRDGRFAAGRRGLAVPRQNGKNAILEIDELYKMVVLGRRIGHTAHEVKTARKAFLRLASFFENPRVWPEMAALVVEVRRTNGQEAIVLTNGASCEFVARSRGSGRGFTWDDLVLDEAQDLTDEHLEALLPTISAAPSGDPQMTLTGTPPGPSSPGEVFTRTREAGVKGKDKRLSWHEWSDDGTGDPNDDQVVANNNPSLGIRLGIEVVRDERAQMSTDGFKRERLGVWASDSGTRFAPSVIRPEVWAALKVDRAPEDGVQSFGVKFSPDGQSVALAVGLRPEVGPVHVEGLANHAMATGTAALVAFLVSRWPSVASIVVDGRSGASAFVEELRKQGVPRRKVIHPTVDQVIAAHAGFLAATVASQVSHIEDPALDASIYSAGRRKIGALGGWGFESVDGGSVTLAESAVLAHWGAAQAKRARTSRRKATVS